MSLAANLNWKLHKINVKNTFLNGELEEKVYMDIPTGLEKSFKLRKVCRLRKSLYELKQSPRVWFGQFKKPLSHLNSVILITHYL